MSVPVVSEVDVLILLATPLSSLKLKELESRINQIYESKIQLVKDLYGEWFATLLGPETLADLPLVMPQMINLAGPQLKDNPGLIGMVRPSYLMGIPAVRGITGDGRPFIAVTLQTKGADKKPLLCFTEVIVKRYPVGLGGGKGEAHENEYVTVRSNFDEGKRILFPSMICPQVDMEEAHVKSLGHFLRGMEASMTDSTFGKYVGMKI